MVQKIIGRLCAQGFVEKLRIGAAICLEGNVQCCVDLLLQRFVALIQRAADADFLGALFGEEVCLGGIDREDADLFAAKINFVVITVGAAIVCRCRGCGFLLLRSCGFLCRCGFFFGIFRLLLTRRNRKQQYEGEKECQCFQKSCLHSEPPDSVL